MVTSKSRAKKLPPGISVRRLDDGSTKYDVQLKVKPYPRLTKTFESIEAAKQWQTDTKKELVKQREGGTVNKDIATRTLADLNASYLQDPKATALHSLKDVKRQLQWWDTHYGRIKVLDFARNIGHYAKEARSKLIPGRKAGTVNRYLAAQRKAWNVERETVEGLNVWPKSVAMTEGRARTRYLTDVELTAVLKAAKATTPTIYATVVTALACGCRMGEMLRLTWADIDFKTKTVRFLETKNDEARSVFLPPIAAKALETLKDGKIANLKGRVFLHDDGEPLTGQDLDRRWRAVRAAAGLKSTKDKSAEGAGFRWHDFRHSCASFLAQNGSSLIEIGSVLGHKSPSVTAKYAHLTVGKAVTGHEALNSKLEGA